MATKSNHGTLRRENDKVRGAMVLIASADAEVRQRWALGLKDFFAIHEVSEWGELKRTMNESKPAVLLLNSDLLQSGEAKGISTIQRLSPSTKIVLLTNGNDEKKAISGLRAGAKGYCNKNIDLSLLLKAVNVVQKGEIWVGRKTISRLLTELISPTESQQTDSPDPSKVYLKHLTSREHQIAQLIGEGACNKEISSRLDISERTVKAHLSAIFYKLQIPGRLRLGLFVNGHNHKVSH